MRILGLDPGLRATGWGLVVTGGARLSHVANGVIETGEGDDVARRLAMLFEALAAMIEAQRPDEAAVEETFVNVNPVSTLKLGLARGVVMLAPARAGLAVAEYATTAVKKSVVGVGHAAKPQVQMMVRRLLPGVELAGADAADALAVAICHAHHVETRTAWGRVAAGAGTRA
jgi:crossover junction endodeoxyribonuclease RuvC